MYVVSPHGDIVLKWIFIITIVILRMSYKSISILTHFSHGPGTQIYADR